MLSTIKLLSLTANAMVALEGVPEFNALPSDEKLVVLRMLGSAQEHAIQGAVYIESIRQLMTNLPGKK